MSVEVEGIVFENSADGSIYGKFKDGDAPTDGIPNDPTNFSASYLSDISISLAWTNNDPLITDNFELDRSLTGTGGWTALTDPAGNAVSATSTGLTVDTQYFYRLRAVNASGNSSYATSNATTTDVGEPTISSVTGTFAQDALMTINGLFSANRNGQIIYENFDAGVDGVNINDIASFNQNNTGATPSHQYKYTDTESFSGSKSAYLDYTVGDGSGFEPDFDFGSDLNRAFVSLKMKINVISETSEPANQRQIKLPRIISDRADHGSTPSAGTTYLGGGGGGIGYQKSEDIPNVDAFYSQGGSVSGDFQSLLYYIDLGTLGVVDGNRFIKALGTDNWVFSLKGFNDVDNDFAGSMGTPPENWEDTNHIKTQVDAIIQRYFRLPFFKRGADLYEIWIDQVSINDSLESVFISPHSTWAVAKADIDTLIIQPMATRIGTKIEVNAEVGNLGASTRYWYALNVNGTANANGGVES